MLGTIPSRMPTLAMGAAMALCLSGCTSFREYIENGFKVGPNYCQPPAPVAEHWIDAADQRVRGPSEDLSRWWTVFRDPVLRSEDPVLDRLVSTAYRQNLSLGEAGFRILEARAQLGIAQGELFPQVQDATGAFRRQGTSLSAPSGLFSPKRVAGGTDRRIRCLRLTPRGERIMRLREEARVHRVLAALEHLSPQVRSDVVGTLETLLDACDATRGRDGQQSVRLAAKADC